MSQFLTILEVDGGAFGGYIPDLQVSATGKSLDQVRERLAQGAALALERLGEVPARAQSFDDLSADDQEAFEGSELQVEFLEPAPMNPVSREISRRLKELGLTQNDLAERLGTSHSAVSRMVSPFYWGHSLELLRRTAEALDAKLTVSLDAA